MVPFFLLQIADFVSRYMPAYKAYLPGLYKWNPAFSTSQHILRFKIDAMRSPSAWCGLSNHIAIVSVSDQTIKEVACVTGPHRRFASMHSNMCAYLTLQGGSCWKIRLLISAMFWSADRMPQTILRPQESSHSYVFVAKNGTSRFWTFWHMQHLKIIVNSEH